MHVLIVEDEEKIARVLAEYFERDGWRCTVLTTGAGVVDVVRARTPDFVVLDLMLPGQGGLSICTAIRRFSTVPILMLTARVDELDRLLGLEIGADDYVCKPFSPREVVSRARVIMRRVRTPSSPAPRSITHQGVRVFPEQYVCMVDGVEVELTPIEFRLLCALIAAPRRVLSRQQLMDAAYDDRRVVSARTIDSHIKNLRRKLAGHDGDELVRPVYGVGYRLA